IDLNLCEDLYADTGAMTPPALTYAHSDPVVPGEGCPTGSSSISGVGFYGSGSYPAEFDGAMILADYSRDCIWAVPPGGDPVTLESDAASPVDVEIGPGGDVFYVDFEGGTIHRIAWNQPHPPTSSAYLSDLAWAGMT